MGFFPPGRIATFVLRHADPSQDKLARDLGYADWADYIRRAVRAEGPLTTFEIPNGPVRGRKVSVVYSRADEDVATIGMHFLRRDGLAVEDFTGADSVTIEGFLDTMLGTLAAKLSSDIAVSRYVWHTFGVGVRAPNPNVRDVPPGSALIGTQDPDKQLPAQVATSVTFKTSVRKQWGRVYLPATTEDFVTAGRFVDGYVDDVRTAFGTLADSAADASLPLVIWSARHAGKLLDYGDGTRAGRAAAHLAGTDNPDDTSFARTVDIVQVDDVPDIIRSRRFDTALRKSTHTLP